MIAHKPPRKPGVPDNYRRLGQYIADAPKDGEKLRDFWIENCNAGTDLDDLDLALAEIDATRAFNTRSEDRTYHLVVSFRPGEEDRLSLQNLQDIEREFARALGFTEHQRVVGTHTNTNNFHMHIAYNKVHPEHHLCHSPSWDFPALARVCRAMEQRYGLHVDVERDKEKNRLPPQARDHEARTWQQSFERHLLEHKEAILEALGAANTWQEAHAALAKFDVALRRRGAGLVFAERDGQKTVRASWLNRNYGKGALEKRLGPWEPAPHTKAGDQRSRSAALAGRRPAPRFPFRGRPLTRFPGQSRLWRQFLQERSAPGLEKGAVRIRSWKDHLMAEAHRDTLALAILLAFKENTHKGVVTLPPRARRQRIADKLQKTLKGEKSTLAPVVLEAFVEDALSLEDAMAARTGHTGPAPADARSKPPTPTPGAPVPPSSSPGDQRSGRQQNRPNRNRDFGMER
ncbi:relaxase/mobilization nuclease domain-containing protein [Phaeovibrio sulfidiphilus]|uniref:Relaxase/mobilization nuclease domain-containing protein n=1 Tax=Phaeovibrio sulfidiphilus TaxID=1220600 RepID=A0A8J7CPS7_9PROT|nr:TraI/MobA(P) family conjugative relaxase [Phaeovibrio sulfidiphilus]MBE1237397.1 relaxase/mobilization nuclease domain-containing protein [Phaeovibrio sulfidiphilus]